MDFLYTSQLEHVDFPHWLSGLLSELETFDSGRWDTRRIIIIEIPTITNPKRSGLQILVCRKRRLNWAVLLLGQ
jgi:hypothetical protein